MGEHGLTKYEAIVKFIIEDDNGKVRKLTEKYLVEAHSVPEAHEYINAEFKDATLDFECTSVKKTAYVKYITTEEVETLDYKK